MYWTHNPITGHNRIHIHSLNLIIPLLFEFARSFLSVLGTETIIYNNVSIDISDTFKLLYFVQKMRKYPPDVNVSETSIGANLKMVERRDPDNFPRFPLQE